MQYFKEGGIFCDSLLTPDTMKRKSFGTAGALEDKPGVNLVRSDAGCETREMDLPIRRSAPADESTDIYGYEN